MELFILYPIVWCFSRDEAAIYLRSVCGIVRLSPRERSQMDTKNRGFLHVWCDNHPPKREETKKEHSCTCAWERENSNQCENSGRRHWLRGLDLALVEKRILGKSFFSMKMRKILTIFYFHLFLRSKTRWVNCVWRRQFVMHLRRIWPGTFLLSPAKTSGNIKDDWACNYKETNLGTNYHIM